MNKYLKNQKGVVLPPLLIWAVVIVGSILIAQDSVKKGYIKINLPSSEQVETVIATPSPEPTLIPIPSVKPTVAPTTNTQQKVNTTQVTHDGSRTGPIVDYNSYCDHKTIKVYENELLWLTASNGKQSYSTKSDMDCYNRDLTNNSQQNQQLGSGNTPSYQLSTPSEPLIDCKLSYGTLRYTQSQCDFLKAGTDAFNNCIAEKDTRLNACKDPVNKKQEEETSICGWAWGPGGPSGGQFGNIPKLNECLNEVSEDRKKAMADCYDTYNREADTCLSNNK